MSTTNTGTDFAGDIKINGKNIQITNNSLIESQGKIGTITIGNEIADSVTIDNSILRTTNNFETEASGDIQINANSQNGSVSLINNTELQAQTSGTGNAGNIIIDANNVTFDGSRAFASVERGGTGEGGNIEIKAHDSLLITNNAGLQALVRDQLDVDGVAGDISILTDDLRIENGAAVSVISPQGEAGNVEIRADKIRLDNGRIEAQTGRVTDRSEAANIILLGKNTTDQQVKELITQISEGNQRGENLPGTSLDHLLLGNESLIQANSESADGGNITIKTRLLLALPATRSQGNDISANALQGNGGVVAIDATPLGIYNIEFRDIPTEESTRNNLNDITATSDIGLNGIVSLFLPDIDPRRGLLKLPEDLGDSSKFITPDCPVGTTQAASRFRVTGRGGLPPRPKLPTQQ